MSKPQNCIDFVKELKEYLKKQQLNVVFGDRTEKEYVKELQKTLAEVNDRIAKFLGSW